MLIPVQYKKLQKLVKNNIYLVIFGLVIVLIGIIAVFKLINTKTDTVYVKAKVSQGLWWANTAKPSVWIASSIREGLVEKNLSGKPINEVISVRTYPWWNTEQYDVYVILKLDVSKNSTTGKYTYKRAPLAVGAPIDMEFPQVQVSATVMEISEQPIKENRKDVIVTLDKKFADAWEVDGLQIGDTYSDGENTVLEVLDKHAVRSSEVFIRVGSNYPFSSEERYNLKVTVKLNVIDHDGELIFHEDQPLQLGRYLNAQTKTLILQDYAISSIELE